MNYSCTFCRCLLNDSKDRYLITGKSCFNIVQAIENLPFSVKYDSDSYICRKCLSLLKKKKNLEQSYDKCLKELESVVQKASRSSSPAIPEPVHTSTPVKAAQTPAEQEIPTSIHGIQGLQEVSETTATVSFLIVEWQFVLQKLFKWLMQQIFYFKYIICLFHLHNEDLRELAITNSSS